jgi:hypothetical protein
LIALQETVQMERSSAVHEREKKLKREKKVGGTGSF